MILHGIFVKKCLLAVQSCLNCSWKYGKKMTYFFPSLIPLNQLLEDGDAALFF